MNAPSIGISIAALIVIAVVVVVVLVVRRRSQSDWDIITRKLSYSRFKLLGSYQDKADAAVTITNLGHDAYYTSDLDGSPFIDTHVGYIKTSPTGIKIYVKAGLVDEMRQILGTHLPTGIQLVS